MFDLFHSALKQNILCRIGSDTFCGLCRLFWLVQMICSAISCILQFSRDTISGISRSLNMQSRTGCWGWNSETGCHASITVYSQNVWLQNPFDEIDEVHHPSNGPQVRLWDPWQTSQKLSVDVLLTCQFSEFLNYMQKKKYCFLMWQRFLMMQHCCNTSEGLSILRCTLSKLWIMAKCVCWMMFLS